MATRKKPRFSSKQSAPSTPDTTVDIPVFPNEMEDNYDQIPDEAAPPPYEDPSVSQNNFPFSPDRTAKDKEKSKKYEPTPEEKEFDKLKGAFLECLETEKLRWRKERWPIDCRNYGLPEQPLPLEDQATLSLEHSRLWGDAARDSWHAFASTELSDEVKQAWNAMVDFSITRGRAMNPDVEYEIDERSPYAQGLEKWIQRNPEHDPSETRNAHIQSQAQLTARNIFQAFKHVPWKERQQRERDIHEVARLIASKDQPFRKWMIAHGIKEKHPKLVGALQEYLMLWTAGEEPDVNACVKANIEHLYAASVALHNQALDCPMRKEAPAQFAGLFIEHCTPDRAGAMCDAFATLGIEGAEKYVPEKMLAWHMECFDCKEKPFTRVPTVQKNERIQDVLDAAKEWELDNPPLMARGSSPSP